MQHRGVQVIACHAPVHTSIRGLAVTSTPSSLLSSSKQRNRHASSWTNVAYFDGHRGPQIHQRGLTSQPDDAHNLATNVRFYSHSTSKMPLSYTPNRQAEHATSTVSSMSVETYLSLRSRGPIILNSIRPRTFLAVARAALQANLHGVVDFISQDVVSIHESQLTRNKANAGFATVFRGLLAMAVEGAAPRNSQVVRLFTAMQKIFPEESLELDVLARVGQAALALPSTVISTQTTSNIANALLHAPRRVTGKHSDVTDTLAVEMLERQERRVTWLLFQLIQRIVSVQDQNAPFDIFKTMVEQGRIPSSALQEADKIPSFHTVVLSALTKSCIVNGWNVRASEILRNTSYLDDIDHNICTRLVESVAVELLTTENRYETQECGQLLAFAIRKWPQSAISQDVLSQFYDSACQFDLGEALESVYVLSMKSTSRYTLYSRIPNGQTLLWLMNWLIRKSQNQHAAQILAKTVAHSPTSLPIQVRAPFIQLCSRASFASEAKALWERYSTGPDSDVVLGHAGTMLRLVSLLMSRVKQRRKDSRTPGDVPSTHINGASVTLAGPATEERIQDQHAKTTLPFEMTFDRDSDTASLSRGRHFSDFKEFEEDENIKFAWHVVDSFRAAKEPLVQATHMDLNALARAYGMLGDVSKCLETLSIVFKRHEVPDIHDINVVIAVMAERDPARAAKAVEGMLAKEVKPDAVTFGTVIHQALRVGDTELAGHMIKLAQTAGIRKLTPQSIASVVQAALRAVVPMEREPENEEDGHQARNVNGETAKGYLERVYDLIASGVYAEYLQSVQMGRTCIAVALRANMPGLAFRFWKMMLKGKEDWDASREQRIRRQISKKLRTHLKQKRIGAREAEWMMRELEANKG